MAKFGTILKKLRLNEKITQKQLATNLDIERQTYCNYEQGIREPSRETLIKIAKYYDVSMDYLFELTDQPSKQNNHYTIEKNRFVIHAIHNIKCHEETFFISSFLFDNLILLFEKLHTMKIVKNNYVGSTYDSSNNIGEYSFNVETIKEFIEHFGVIAKSLDLQSVSILNIEELQELKNFFVTALNIYDKNNTYISTFCY
ncbi:MAG: helix-turn-helix transcriptional regulator [Patescibacteria group bacterium]|jgi:transcriptional regulator with XRE-family HTH domain